MQSVTLKWIYTQKYSAEERKTKLCQCHHLIKITNLQASGRTSLKAVSLGSLSVHLVFLWSLSCWRKCKANRHRVLERTVSLFYMMLSRHGNNSSFWSVLPLTVAKSWCLWREVEGKSGPFMGFPLVVIPACCQLWLGDFLQSLWHSVFFLLVNSSGLTSHPGISGRFPNLSDALSFPVYYLML